MTTGSVLDLRTTELCAKDFGHEPIRTLAEARARAERGQIMATLREANWVVGGRRGAAARLGLARTTLITMMQRLGISHNKVVPIAGNSDRPFAAVHSYEPDGVQEDCIYTGRTTSSNNARQLASGRWKLWHGV
jgi:hypothetical protein